MVGKQSLEYLLLASSSELESEHVEILEEGFRSSKSNANPVICVTNSLGFVRTRGAIKSPSCQISCEQKARAREGQVSRTFS